MGCVNSKEIQNVKTPEIKNIVVNYDDISIEVIDNSIINTCEVKIKNEFCDICILYKNDKMKHCVVCNECHNNNKSFFCELCSVCVNFSSELDIMRHRKRHDVCIMLRERNKSI